MPIFSSSDEVVGVAQLVNKKGSAFTNRDETIFRAFAVYCGLSIAAVQMYDRANTAATKYKVVLDVLAYQACSSSDEAKMLCESIVPTSRSLGLTQTTLDTQTFREGELPIAVLRMFADCHFVEAFRIPYRTLCRWILSVRQNYRDVTYHNWRHAFSVAQTPFLMIKRAQLKRYFTALELMGLAIAAICPRPRPPRDKQHV